MNDIIGLDSSTGEAHLTIDDIAPLSGELSADEVRAVSGGLYTQRPSWGSGPSGRTDEWTIVG